VCVSQSQHTWLLDNFPEARGKTSHIGNGVFLPSRQHSTPKAVKAEDRQTLKLVSVGSLIRRKGHAQVIETLASLPADSGVTLTVIGEGQDHMGLQNLITRLGLDSHVTLAGHVAPDLIPDILLEHDAFILCSYSEGRSNAILEAMASGIPVIATDIPGTNELIRNNHNGILVPCDSSESLRSAILQLRDNPDMRESLGQSAVQTILDLDLTWERASNDYLGLYNALINNNIES
jgi:glycosyltransferase involved in cell wall biosynthesis